MAGIFPEGGTLATNTRNAQNPVNVTAGCAALFYRANCVPVFDPLSTNAIISEIVNAVNGIGGVYDCSKLDNLSSAIQAATNICTLPTLAEVGVTGPDLNDSLGGCFDGSTARLSFQELIDFLEDNLGLTCRLPVNLNPDLTKTRVAACVDGEEQAVRATDIIALGLGGIGYRWYDVVAKRFNGTWYKNDTGYPLQFNVTCQDDAGCYVGIEPNFSTATRVNAMQADGMPLTAIVPPEQYYLVAGSNRYIWTELRLGQP